MSNCLKKWHKHILAASLIGLHVTSCSNERAPADTPAAAESNPKINAAPLPPSINNLTWEQEYTGQGEIDRNNSLALARTLQEAQWLRRQGFFSNSQLEKLSSLPRSELEARVRSGDQDATLFVADQLIQAGQGERLIRQVEAIALEQGSIPAMYLAAKHASSLAKKDAVKADLARPSRNNVTANTRAASMLMLAYSRGDYRAGQLLFSVYPDGVPPIAFTEGMKLAQEMDRRYGEAHGGRKLPIDPRPISSSVYGLREDEP